MKQILLYMAIFIGSISVASAQNDQPKQGQRVEALYIAYITKEINLTEDEAQRFWPIHAQFDAEIKTANLNQNELERQQTTLNIRKKYQDRFVKIIGVDRTNTFFKTDAAFRDKMIDVLRKRRQQNKNGGRIGAVRQPMNLDN